MKRERNNQLIKKVTTGILLFVLSLSVISVFNQEGNTVLATETTEVERTIKEDEKKAYITVEYSGTDGNVYIEKSGEEAVPTTPEDYSTWIFAGWYEEDTCDTPIKKSVADSATCYAKFVPEKVLSVKCQTQEVEEGKSNLRFVTSIDTTNYYRAGFEVSREYSVTNEDGSKSTEVKTYKKETNNSFKRIVASLDSKVTFEYSPKVIDTKSESFVTYTIKNIPSSNYDTEFLVKPYWITLDGAKVYGVSRYVAVNDDENTVVNIPIKVDAAATYSSENFTVQRASKATDGTESFTDVTGATVRYRANEHYASIILSNEQELKSATKYQVSGGGTATYVHRNLETVYAGTNTEDTSWYTAYDENTTQEYVIATAADLYGLAKLTTKEHGKKFVGKTIYVVSDIEANKGVASPTGWSGETSYEWSPIGNNSVKFSGVFDGQMHTISGICDQTVTASYSGLFGYTADESLVSKFSLTNSYFYYGTTTEWLGYGSIVGCSEGDIDTVYSNSNLNYAGDIRQIAGIVGRVSGKDTNTGDVEITNCWFDGTISCGDATVQLGVGGVVGASNQATTLEITNCLNTGTITQTGETTDNVKFCIGGIFGTDWGDNCNITISNCLNSGSIIAEGTNSIGTIVGRITKATATYSIDKTFCVSGIEISGTTISNVGSKNGGAKITKNNITAKDSEDVNGHVSYLNVSDLGFYGNSKSDEDNENKYWVAREKADNIKDGVPALKSFAEYIDVAWYYDTDGYDAGNNTYTIYTEEELFGFSEISQGYNFKNDIVQLGDDIEVNMGGDAEKWAAGTETPERQWRPIGSNTADYRFAGTFNGEDPKTGEIYTISGIYITSTDTQYVGFFSTIAAEGVVKNFRLTNSYMYAKNTSTTADKLAWGSIAGGLYGDIDTVYTNMHLCYDNGRQIGGIVGRIAGTELQEIKNCWSDGTMELIGNSTLQQAGGIAGATNANAIVTFDNCLNTRQIIVSGALASNGRIAGLFGGDNGKSTITIQNCLEAGIITDSSTCSGDKYIGSIIGRMNNANSTYTINNVYCKESTLSVVGSRNVTAVKEVIVPVDTSNLNDENGFSYTTLDFKNTWAVRKDNVPGLLAFVDGGDINLDKARYDVRWYYDLANVDASTYTIDNEDELYGLAHLVNAGIETFVDEEGNKKTVQLGADIEINAVEEDTVAKWESGEETPINVWTPIGTSDNKFAGIMDGKDPETNELHMISGLYMYEAGANSGLFGATAAGSTVRNLKLDNSFIRSTGTATGSIVGLCYGNVDTVYSNAIVKGTGSCYQLGGIVGHARGSSAISNCWFGGRVQSGRTAATYEGGIVGAVSNSVSLSNCLNTGTVKSTVTDNTKTYYIGGIVGGQGYIGAANSVLTITDCMNAGTMDTKVSNYVGIMVGGIASQTNYTRQCTITDGYTVEVSCTDADDVTVSLETIGYYNTSDTGITVSNDTIVLADKSEYYGIEGYRWAKGLSFADKWAARKDEVPALQSFVGSGLQIADGLLRYDTDWFYEGEPYEITSEEEFYGFTKLVSKGNKFTNQTVTLTTDIDMNIGWTVGNGVPTNVWEPIGNDKYQFEGSFDGQEHTIRGIYVDITTQDAGLFGYVGGGDDTAGSYAVLQDFALTNSYINSTNSRVGSIAGCFSGDIYNVYSDTTVKGKGQTGGLVGYYTAKYDGEIKDCWYKGNLTTSGQYGGGIVGRIGMGTKTIENCLFSGILNSTYSTTNDNGAAIGGLIGGIVPGNNDGTKYPTAVVMNNNLSAGSVSGKSEQSGIGAVVGTINSYTKDGKTNTPTVTANSIYGITEDSVIGANLIDATVNVTSLDKDDILGRKAYNQTGFNFESDWTSVAYDVPAPKNLESIAKDIPWLSLDTSWYRNAVNALTFEIGTVEKLYGVSYLVNRGVDDFAEQTISLTGKIEVNETSEAILSSWKVDGEGEIVPANEWIPIGTKTSGKRFAGTFNGNGNTISGIYVSTDDNTGTYVGLFGSVNTTGIVQNLKLMDSYFRYNGTANSNENKELHLMMGSITAELRGCLQNVYSNAIIDSTASNVGGLVSRAVDTSTDEGEQVNILSCWFDGEVNLAGNARYSGGIVATTGGGNHLIDNCLNTGVISCERTSGLYVGGILGTDYLAADGIEITNCLSAGTLMLASNSYAGTVVGTVNKVTNVATDESGATIGHIGKYTITNSYATEQTTTSDASVSRIGGKSDYSNEFAALREGITSVEAKEIEGRNAYSMSLDFENIWTAREYDVPGIKYLTPEEHQLLLDTTWYRANETASSYTLTTADQLYGLGYLVNNGTDDFAQKTIAIGATDIVVNATEEEGTVDSWKDSKNAPVNEWVPIGIDSDGSRFAGHFDGNTKTISGIYVNQNNSYIGLFATTEEGSSIENLRLTNSYFNYTGNGTAYMGSVVGDLRGDMMNVYSNAIIDSNGAQTGGVVGQVNAITKESVTNINISNCWYDGQLTSSKSYTAGLIACAAQGTVYVDNCLNTGEITTTYNDVNNAAAGICAQVTGASNVTITDTIAAGKIIFEGHAKNIKSVVGYIPNGTVTFENVFATKEVCSRTQPSTGATGSYTGSIIRTQKENRLMGYCLGEAVEGETVAKLAIPSEWTIRTSDVPVPSCFVDLVKSVTVAEGSTLDATLNEQLGLNMLSLSIVNAIDMGEGNYVLEKTVNDDTYNGYIETLEGELGFGTPVAENSAGAGKDGVHSVSYKKQNPDWVLTLTYVETTDVLTISINTDTDSLSDNLVYTEGVEDENFEAKGDIIFSMLQMEDYSYSTDDEGNETKTPIDAIYADLEQYGAKEYSYWYGNSFVFQLPNDHFIINDGGTKEEFDDLVNYLRTAVGTTEEGERKPVYIDAWIVSHQHGDHFDIMRAIDDNLDEIKDIYVDAFYISEPSAQVLAQESLTEKMEKQHYGMSLFKKNKEGEPSDIYRMQTGQRYYFNGIIMDVIQAQEQIMYKDYANYNANNSDKKDFNTVSTVTLFTTSNKQKILIGGDANYVNMEYIMKAYDSNGEDGDVYTPTSLLQNINSFVAFHHGKNMSMNIGRKKDIFGITGREEPDYSFINYLTYGEHYFDYVLYPCSLIYNDNSDPVDAFPNAGEANDYLNGKVKNNQYYHFGNGHVEITLQQATTE